MYLIAGCGWPLFLFYFAQYRNLKLEAATYVTFSAKKQASSNFDRGEKHFLVLPTMNTMNLTGLTNGYATVPLDTLSNDSEFAVLFVNQYNERMKELIDKRR
jgi:hypothetical protein